MSRTPMFPLVEGCDLFSRASSVYGYGSIEPGQSTTVFAGWSEKPFPSSMPYLIVLEEMT
jgi:hypothetical protein